MSVIVSRVEFIEAVNNNDSAWFFTNIATLPKEISKALRFHALSVELIMSAETAMKNLRRHPELQDVETILQTCEAAMQTPDLEIVGSGTSAVQVFFRCEGLLWEIVVKRSKNDEAICTSLHRADRKRVLKARKKGPQLGMFTIGGL
jgi:hypothetical protein